MTSYNLIYDVSLWKQLKPLELNDESLIKIQWDKYFEEEYEKNQIVLHHTVSGEGIRGDLLTWKQNKSNVATCIIIERNGNINQMFPSKYWGYHLGANNWNLDKHSIAIELDNWGGLILGDGTSKQFGKNPDGSLKMIKTVNGQFYTTYGNIVNIDVTYYKNKFRGYEYYESYSYEQIKSTGELILLWSNKYNIPLKYNDDMWDVSQKALNGDKGIWTHVSYRKPSDKQDCHPDNNLINMLKSLK